MKNITAIVTLVTFTFLVVMLSACGGGGGGGGGSVAGIGGTGKIASGTITGFGSIFVNGVEYTIDTARCEIDGVDETGNCQTNLRLGMVVTVTAVVTGNSGIASEVVFEAALEGPVTSLVSNADGITRQFAVLGTPVVIDRTATRFDDDAGNFGFDTIAEGDVLELSGFFEAGGRLQATYVERKPALQPGVTEVELSGTVTDAPPGGAIAGDSFRVNGTLISLLPATGLGAMPGGRVSNGNQVKVKGVVNNSAGVDATRVEPQSAGIGQEGDEISLQGLVADFNGDLSSFTVAGQAVDASAAVFDPPGLQPVNGMSVEVEGRLASGVLRASELELRGGNDIRIDARVSSVTASSVQVQLGDGSIDVRFDNQTRLEDDSGGLENFRLSDISAGDFLEIRGFEDGDAVVASEVKRSETGEIILQGPVDSVINESRITILGVGFFVNSATRYEDSNEQPVSSSEFFAGVRSGSIVKIRDEQPADGSADEVDLED